MARFLSDAWLEELGAAARASSVLQEAAVGLGIVIEQVITGATGGEVRYHWVLDDGAVAVVVGPAPGAADITLTTDWATAVALASGDVGAQDAFLAGRLRLGGDIALLVRAGGAMAAVEDVARAVREATTYG